MTKATEIAPAIDKLTLAELAEKTGARLQGDGTTVIRAISGITEARPDSLTFVSNKKYIKHLGDTRASAVIVAEGMEELVETEGKNLLIAKDPYLAFAIVMNIFFKPVHPVGGKIDKGAAVRGHVSESAGIGVGAVIEEGASVGDRSVIYPNVYIGRGSSVGIDCVIYPGVCVREGVTIGDRVTIHANAVIGSDGFGYARDGARQIKIPQVGGVVICDDVEIGASVTIDRGAMGDTFIGRGTKIDNLVQIAHNVRIGEDSLIVAQVGISGSTTIGDRVTAAGQCGFAGHINIADDTIFGAQSGVPNDVKEKGVYMGYPIVPHRDWLRLQAIIKGLPKLKKKVEEIAKKLGDKDNGNDKG